MVLGVEAETSVQNIGLFFSMPPILHFLNIAHSNVLYAARDRAVRRCHALDMSVVTYYVRPSQPWLHKVCPPHTERANLVGRWLMRTRYTTVWSDHRPCDLHGPCTKHALPTARVLQVDRVLAPRRAADDF